MRSKEQQNEKSTRNFRPPAISELLNAGEAAEYLRIFIMDSPALGIRQEKYVSSESAAPSDSRGLSWTEFLLDNVHGKEVQSDS